MTCVYHIITQNSFITPKITNALPVRFSLPPAPLVTTHLFLCLRGFFSFPECHAVEIIQYIAFSVCFLSFSNMDLRFLCIFSWLDDGTFLFTGKLRFHCMDVSQFIHFPVEGHSGLLGAIKNKVAIPCSRTSLSVDVHFCLGYT